MTAIVLTLISVPSAQASGAADTQLPGRVTAKVAPETAAVSERDNGSKIGMGLLNADLSAASAVGVVSARTTAQLDSSRSETCRSARIGLRFYRMRQRDWQSLHSVPSRIGRKPHGCADARYLASVARERASIARRGYELWLERRTLRDFAFAPGADAWPKAVREVQRVFPGTEGWLLSCSAAEGGHGRWVGYGGQGYSTWLRDSDTVGGPLQYRFSTHRGMFRLAADYARSREFRLPAHLQDQTAAWRSALGQALAGAWARFTGNDNSHWSASWGRGC